MQEKYISLDPANADS